MSKTVRGPRTFGAHPLIAVTRTRPELFRLLSREAGPPVATVDCGEDDESVAAAVAEVRRQGVAAIESRRDMPAEDLDGQRLATQVGVLVDGFLQAYRQQEKLLPTAWYGMDREVDVREVEPDWVVRWVLAADRGPERGTRFGVSSADLEQVGLMRPPPPSRLGWIGDLERADEDWSREARDALYGASPSGPSEEDFDDGVDLADATAWQRERADDRPEWAFHRFAYDRGGWDDVARRIEALTEIEHDLLDQPRPAGWRAPSFGDRYLLAVPLRQQEELLRVVRLMAAVWVRLLAPPPPGWMGRDEPFTLGEVAKLSRLREEGGVVRFATWSESGRATTPEQDQAIARFMAAEAAEGTRAAKRHTLRLVDVAADAPDSPCWSLMGGLFLAHGYLPPRSWRGLLAMARGLLHAVQPTRVVAPLAGSPAHDDTPTDALDLISRQLVSLVNESTNTGKPLPRICQWPSCGNYYVRQPPRADARGWSPHARGTMYCTRQCAQNARQARHRMSRREATPQGPQPDDAKTPAARDSRAPGRGRTRRLDRGQGQSPAASDPRR